eukprot:s7422_g6.t1
MLGPWFTMVVLWVLSRQHSRRCLDPAPLPFNNGKRMRRRIAVGACSNAVRELVEAVPYQFRNANVPYIYGAVDVSTGFIYSHAARLGDLDREQYRHWRKLGVAGEDQWFFNCENSVALPYSHAARLGDLDREQYRHWRKLGVAGEDQWFFNCENSVALPARAGGIIPLHSKAV